MGAAFVTTAWSSARSFLLVIIAVLLVPAAAAAKGVSAAKVYGRSGA